MPRNHFFLAKMARFRLRKFQDSNIPRTQASCMPRTPSCMPGTASCMPGTASCMPKHQLLGFQYALVAVGSCLRRFYFLKTGPPFQTKALVAVEGCLRRFYFLKTQAVGGGWGGATMFTGKRGVPSRTLEILCILKFAFCLHQVGCFLFLRACSRTLGPNS